MIQEEIDMKKAEEEKKIADEKLAEDKKLAEEKLAAGSTSQASFPQKSNW